MLVAFLSELGSHVLLVCNICKKETLKKHA